MPTDLVTVAGACVLVWVALAPLVRLCTRPTRSEETDRG